MPTNKKIILRAFIGAVAWLLAMTPPVLADEDITSGVFAAVAQSLGFLDSLPRDGTIVLGIILGADDAESMARAQRAASGFSATPGPNGASFHPVIMTSDALAAGHDRLDAIYLMPGIVDQAGKVVEAARQRHVVSISNDTACLAAGYCVLLIRAGARVEITLNTALAGAVGAKFGPVFAMMVKRI